MQLCMDEYGIFPLMKVPRGMSDAVASRPESGSFFFPSSTGRAGLARLSRVSQWKIWKRLKFSKALRRAGVAGDQTTGENWKEKWGSEASLRTQKHAHIANC